MSPASLRRYRAERLLRREFEALRGGVIAAVERRLRAGGPALDRCDLEACYAVAWQGLYMATLEGAEIANPAAWLVLVSFRRAVEEQRARSRAQRGAERIALALWGRRGRRGAGPALARESDLAAELDDRVRLRRLFEGLRGRLSEREREAAVLCYLHGLTRAEAAARMGVSEARMRKLMEGRGRAGPGVAGKVGALVESIRDGDWCEEQGSLMRALAFGILEPRGDRHRLALAHVADCPGCRAYVGSLRGLAAVLPPALAPWSLAVAALAHGEAAHGPSVGLAGSATGARLGGSVSAAAGAGSGAGAAAGGGWLIAGGPLGAKLALGCLLALGAGCAWEAGVGPHQRAPRHAQERRAHPARSLAMPASPRAADAGASAHRDGAIARAASGPTLTPAARASREFGLARALASDAGGAGARRATRPRALAASASRALGPQGSAAGAGGSVPDTAPSVTGGAVREFSPG
jgi:DNA-directed RNA polymerase specialized sigma24 family protein